MGNWNYSDDLDGDSIIEPLFDDDYDEVGILIFSPFLYCFTGATDMQFSYLTLVVTNYEYL